MSVVVRSFTRALVAMVIVVVPLTVVGVPDAGATSAATVIRLASPNPGSVNAYLLVAVDGVVVIDASRNMTQGKRIVQAVHTTGKPLRAILLTHPHPDHVGGLGVLHAAYPHAPIYASSAALAWMRADPLHIYDMARTADPDFPATLTYPTRTFSPGATVNVAGLRFQTVDLPAGESATATVYREVGTQRLFSGDVTDNKRPRHSSKVTAAGGWSISYASATLSAPTAPSIPDMASPQRRERNCSSNVPTWCSSALGWRPQSPAIRRGERR